MKKNLKRMLAIFLTAVMVLCMAPISASAADAEIELFLDSETDDTAIVVVAVKIGTIHAIDFTLICSDKIESGTVEVADEDIANSEGLSVSVSAHYTDGHGYFLARYTLKKAVPGHLSADDVELLITNCSEDYIVVEDFDIDFVELSLNLVSETKTNAVVTVEVERGAIGAIDFNLSHGDKISGGTVKATTNGMTASSGLTVSALRIDGYATGDVLATYTLQKSVPEHICADDIELNVTNCADTDSHRTVCDVINNIPVKSECEFTFSHYQDEHPHYAVYVCKGCGAEQIDYEQSVYSDECDICTQPDCEFVFSHYQDKHPHYAVYVCTICGAEKTTTGTTIISTCEICTSGYDACLSLNLVSETDEQVVLTVKVEKGTIGAIDFNLSHGDKISGGTVKATTEGQSAAHELGVSCINASGFTTGDVLATYTLQKSVPEHICADDVKIVVTNCANSYVNTITCSVINNISVKSECEFTFSHYQEEHPHYAVYVCEGCGTEQIDYTQTSYELEFWEYQDEHPHYAVYKCSVCGAEYIGENTIYSEDCKECTSSGSCGENLTWYFDEETGTLTISGTGKMYDFRRYNSEYDYWYTECPWGVYVYNSQIEKVIIENGVTTISDYAFECCYGLTEITIADTVTSIGEYAFAECETLENLIIPDGVITIGEHAFDYCTSLSSIAIPDSVEVIGDAAFRDCGITSINVSNGNKYYTSVNGVLFNKDKTTLIQYPREKSGASYIIPNTVTKIENHAFSNSNLTNISVPDSVISIGDYAFYMCDFTNIKLPNKLQSIGEYAFYYCWNLTEITIPDTVKTLSYGAFSNCYELKKATVNSETIGNRAFNKCTSLEAVILSDKLKKIDECTFAYCALEVIHIPTSVTDIGEDILSATTAYICSDTEDCYAKTYADENGIEFKLCDGHGISYTVNFYNGETLLGSKTLKLDEDGTLSYGKIPSKEGYKFVGWSSVKGGPALYTDGMAIKNLATENGAVVNYYAVWSKISVDTSEADDDTGVIVDIPADTYDGEVTLEVEEILSGSSFNIVNSMNGAIASKVFSIETYVNGEKVQPNGYVTVRIPIPDGCKPANCAIYYINTQSGTPETVPFKVENGYFVFKTNHFSDWAIVEMGEKTVVSITVTAQPSVNRYKYGIENLDTTGLEIVATYSDGSTAVIDNSEVEFTGFDTSTRGFKTITATYEGCTATFDIEVYYTFWQWLLYILCFGWIWM